MSSTVLEEIPTALKVEVVTAVKSAPRQGEAHAPDPSRQSGQGEAHAPDPSRQSRHTKIAPDPERCQCVVPAAPRIPVGDLQLPLERIIRYITDRSAPQCPRISFLVLEEKKSWHKSSVRPEGRAAASSCSRTISTSTSSSSTVPSRTDLPECRAILEAKLTLRPRPLPTDCPDFMLVWLVASYVLPVWTAAGEQDLLNYELRNLIGRAGDGTKGSAHVADVLSETFCGEDDHGGAGIVRTSGCVKEFLLQQIRKGVLKDVGEVKFWWRERDMSDVLERWGVERLYGGGRPARPPEDGRMASSRPLGDELEEGELEEREPLEEGELEERVEHVGVVL